MAEMEWTRPVAKREPTPLSAVWQRLTNGLLDWETGITLVLALGAVVAVAGSLEDGGWRKDMPPLTVVAVIAVISGMLLARSRISATLAFPIGILTGALIVFWQTLAMAGPGTLSDRLWAVHDRFDAWFTVVDSSAVTNDPLPFNVLILSVTWLGVMLFAWSVYRWHNAWLGLIPGGAALFLDQALVGDNLTGAIALYMLFGLLLVMQTNLLASVRQWRRQLAEYPAMINLTFLHFSLWALVLLMAFAWIIPAGLQTPGPVQSLAEDALSFASRYVRLAGPLTSHKVIPVFSYSDTLPLSGSVDFGDRDLMQVSVGDPRIAGQMVLRGRAYDEYQGGGWSEAASAVTASLPVDRIDALQAQIDQALANGETPPGALIPLHIEMAAKTLAGVVIYVPGAPVTTNHALTVKVPESAVQTRRVNPRGTRGLNDDDAYQQFLDLSKEAPIAVNRNSQGAITAVQYVPVDALGLLDSATLLDPGARVQRYQSYDVVGYIPSMTPESLRAAGADYPQWVTDDYLQRPQALPTRIADKVDEAYQEFSLLNPSIGAPHTEYDKAIAIQDYLRHNYAYDQNVPDTPPGRDYVDYFLFDTLRGHFQQHASAMVVMLRMDGIPARLAVGFRVDDTDRNGTGAYVVKDKNSYAWPEVYFPGTGWVPFNPTPDHDATLLPRTDAKALPQSTDHDITKDVPAAISGNDNGVKEIDEVPQPDSQTPLTSVSGDQPLAWYVSALVTVFLAALVGAVMLGWQRSVAGLPYAQQVWEKTVRLAGWGGLRPEPGQTPADYAGRIGRRFRDIAADMPLLASAYTKSRFGHKELTEEETAAIKDAWPEVRSVLVGGIGGRFFRRNKKD